MHVLYIRSSFAMFFQPWLCAMMPTIYSDVGCRFPIVAGAKMKLFIWEGSDPTVRTLEIIPP
jgi:hypothetical protein